MRFQKVGVVGAGQMGAGIAQVFAQAGTDVLLFDAVPKALAGAKRLLHASLESTLESHLAREAESISTASGGAEGIEGIAAFVEKRAPVFPEQ